MLRLLLFSLSLSIPVAAWGTGGASGGLTAGLENPGYHEMPAWFKSSFLDLREDVDEAATDGRRLLLYVYQDGCPYCAKLLRESFGDRRISALTQARFEVVAINLWGDREVTGLSAETTTEKRLAAGLGVQYTPTLLLLNEDGQPVLRINGYYPPDRLELALRYVGERRELAGESFQAFSRTQAPRKAGGQLHLEGGFLGSQVLSDSGT